VAFSDRAIPGEFKRDFMKLNNEQLIVFCMELERRLPPGCSCSLCGGRNFSISSYVLNVLSYIDIEAIDGGLHVIPLVCDKCGNVFFICPEVLAEQRVDDLCRGVGVINNETSVQER